MFNNLTAVLAILALMTFIVSSILFRASLDLKGYEEKIEGAHGVVTWGWFALSLGILVALGTLGAIFIGGPEAVIAMTIIAPAALAVMIYVWGWRFDGFHAMRQYRQLREKQTK